MTSRTFEHLIERIEQAIDDAPALAALRSDIEAADVPADERERLDGLVDRYEEELRLQAEADETERVLHEEGLA